MQLAKNDAYGNHRDGWGAVESAPLFAGVSPEDYRRITAAARLKRFAPGEMLYLEGDTVVRVLLLISGAVKMTQLGPKGMEVILRIGAPGDVLDPVGLFSTGTHCTTGQAMRRCGTLVWDAEVFEALLEGLPVLNQNIARFTCGHLLELEERFCELATEQVAPRVARQLVRLHEQVGSPRGGEVEIALTRESLAQMTGTSLYTVCRLLSAWETNGLVNSRWKSVTISNVRSLRKIFEENEH
jgi:CRP-like cAMP-binding protein